MVRRLNITLSEQLVAQADAFAARERYTRSALIAAALKAFIERDPRMFTAEGSPGVFAPESVGLNPAVRPFIADFITKCRDAGAVFAGLFGASTRPDPTVVPREVEVAVRFAPDKSAIQHALVLQASLQVVSRMAVKLIDLDKVKPEDRAEYERTLAVIYDADVAAVGGADE